MPHQTDERLKSYLDTNQLHREQMCLAVMAIDKRFSDVRPRHPRGGPDGGRDIEAVFKGELRAFGALGFVNQANDSQEHKKSAANKFNHDLRAALEQQPKPDVFVFFTNVTLTVGEKGTLIDSAKVSGLTHAEVFDREQIRVSLDGPDGLGIRYQYLGLTLSDAEQATFFARWGDDIQGVISSGFGELQRSLNRISFFQEAALFLRYLTAVIELDKEYSGAAIGHFRIFACLYLCRPVDGLVSIIFGAADNSKRFEASTVEELARGQAGIAHSMCGHQWEMRIRTGELETGKYEGVGGFTSIGKDPVDRIKMWYGHHDFLSFRPEPRLQDFDNCTFVFWLNRSFAEKVKKIHIYANEYKLTEIGGDAFAIDQRDFKLPVSILLTDEELAEPWVTISPIVASGFHIRFSEMTPKRFFYAIEIADSLSSS